MTESETLMHELKAMLVDTLMLEDVSAQEIEDDAPLFGEGLGLDSIDALELSVALKSAYGIEFRSDDERNAQIFRSVRSMADFILEQRSA